ETGTVSYTYNTDGTMATKTDAKGQKVVYVYDGNKRVTQIQRYPSPGTVEDLCQRTSIYYDTNPLDATFSQNSTSRKTAVQWSGTACATGYQFAEMYSYTPGGLMSGKRFRTNNGSGQVASLTTSQTYTNEGRVSTVTYPTAFDVSGNVMAGATYTYTY